MTASVCTPLRCTHNPLDRKVPQDCATLALSSNGRQAWLCRDAEPTLWWWRPPLQPAADSGCLQWFFLQSSHPSGWKSKMSVWQSWYTPTITLQSGSRLSLCCLTMPCLTSCSGVMGWKTDDRGLHSVPSSLTTTTVLHSGTTLSTSTYFPLSENTWANLRKGEEWWDWGGDIQIWDFLCFTGPWAPCRVEICLLHKYFQMSECTEVPARVTVKQVVFLIHWEVAELAVLGI